jgi:hypothetical protein
MASIQGDSGEKANVLGGDTIGYCEKKLVWTRASFWTVTDIRLFETTNTKSLSGSTERELAYCYC